MKAVVIGAGSIGLNHLRYVVERFGLSGVVDINPERLAFVESEMMGEVKGFLSLKAVLKEPFFDKEAIFVVSNLGPDHFGTVKTLLAHGVQKIYVEKPLATSIDSCNEILELQASTSTRIAVGFQRRQSGLVQAVQDVATKYCGGSPTSIVVHGGAVDMSTNGIHWLDFSCALFGGLPHSVTGAGGKQRINPRREDLFFWDGVLSWSFSENRRFTLVLDNQSAVSPTVSVYCRNGIVEVLDEGLATKVRESEAVQKFPQVTRHGPAVEAAIISADNLGLTDGRAKLFDLLLGEEDLGPALVESAGVTAALWAGLWALENSKTVELPVATDHPSASISWAAS